MSQPEGERGTEPVALDLEGIRRRCEAASPGPWIADVGSDGTQIGPQDGVNDPHDGGLPYTRRPIVENAVKRGGRLEDFHFIAHAREDVPALIAEVERLRALRAASPETGGAQEEEDRDRELLGRGALTIGIAEPHGDIGVWQPRKRNPIAVGDTIAEAVEAARKKLSGPQQPGEE